jgi:hypothetical protein
MKKALVLNTDWQSIEKSLREEFGYIVYIKDTKEGALEWCREKPIDLIVGSFHMGIIELSGSLSQHISQSGSAFATQNPNILLTWHPDFYEDRYDDGELGQSQFNIREDGEYEHKPHPLIEQSGIPIFKKPYIDENFNTIITQIETNTLV